MLRKVIIVCLGGKDVIPVTVDPSLFYYTHNVRVKILIDMSYHERSVVKAERVMNEAGRRLAIL